MGFPARPPGLVPAMKPGKGRVRMLDGLLPDRAVGAPVDLLNEESGQSDIPQIGVKSNCGFHFISPDDRFLVVFLLP